MSIDIQSAITKEPFQRMTIRGVITAYGSSSDDRMPDVTGWCMTHNEFCEEVDSLIRRLEELKDKARIKFDEFKRDSN